MEASVMGPSCVTSLLLLLLCWAHVQGHQAPDSTIIVQGSKDTDSAILRRGGQDAGSTILDVAEQLGATEFVKYCKFTGVDNALTKTGPITAFVPTNAAFSSLPDQIKDSLSDKDYTRQLLDYHVTNGSHLLSSFRNEMLIRSYNDKSVRINIYQDPNITLTSASGSVISLADVPASNGVIHVLTRVMFQWPAIGPLDSTIGFVPYLQFVLYGFYHANMSREIQKGGPFTVFAPVDPVWEALPPSYIDNLRNNHTALREVMKNHVVKGTYFTPPMYENQTLRTMAGNELAVHLHGSNVTVNGALIILADFIASNGVVQLTNKVFLPPGTNVGV